MSTRDPVEPDAAAVNPAAIQAELLAALATRLEQVDIKECVRRYGTMEGILATMLQSFPDRVITDPHIGPCFTAGRLAKVRGVTRQAISKQHLAGKLFGVKHGGEWLYPSVQFDAHARTRPAFTALFIEAGGAEQDPSEFAVWLHTPDAETGVSPALQIELAPDTRSETEKLLDGFVPEMITVTGKGSPRTTKGNSDA